ncbi:MAG: MFS transporter, partial [Acetobacteraceae bacterium]|nr:MFS transporter [Acetobacteraceae bacterium]
MIDVLGVTVLVSALPRMLATLRAPQSTAGLVATCYAMFFGGLLMLGARLGDRLGHRNILLVGLLLFAGASALAGAAPSLFVLVTARCAQGAAAAASVPSALRLLTTITADGPQRRKAIAVWSAAGAAAGASGFVAGGVVTDLVGWRAVFWAYVPLALALAVAIGRAVPPDQAAGRSIRLSLASSAIFTATVMAFVVATTLLPEQRRAVPGMTLLGCAVVLAWLFIAVDRRSSAPLLPRALLRERPLRQGAFGGLLNTLTTSSVITLATLYMQNTRGRSPLVAGLMLLPFSLAVIGGSALAAPLLARWRPQRVVAAGLTTIAVCDAALILAASSSWALPLCVAVCGAGIGMSSVAATGLGTSVAVSARGTASGIINTAAQLGTAVGIAMLLLVAALTTGVPEPHK